MGEGRRRMVVVGAKRKKAGEMTPGRLLVLQEQVDEFRRQQGDVVGKPSDFKGEKGEKNGK